MLPTGISRQRLGESLAEWAIRERANHFLTLQPGLFGRSIRDADGNVLQTLGNLFKDYARLRRELPRRYVIARDDLPCILGVLERFDGFGNAAPHLHCFIALDPEEEPLLRGYLRSMFGSDKTEGAGTLPAIVRDKGHVLARGEPKSVPVDFPTKLRLVGHWNSNPTFDLQPISRSPEKVGRYMTKQFRSPDIITHLDLYDAALTRT